MKVLLIHNRYRQRGGEDAVVDDELRLLREGGHAVRLYERHNDDIDARPLTGAAEMLWSQRSRREVLALLDAWRPDVAHVHNTLALVSPSVLGAVRARRVALVATLHNHRLACLEGSFHRNGAVCTRCLGHAPWAGVVHGCWRGSKPQSALLAASLLLHRGLGSWTRHVQRFIVLSAAAVPRFVAGGLPAARLRVRPNFAWDAAPGAEGQPRAGGLYVGRLAAEKGVAVLADALARSPGLALDVIGDGPQRALLHGSAARLLGALPAAEVAQHMQRAAWLVLPSTTLEQFPRVLAEACAAGLPVIASRLGALAEWVHDRRTGLLFEPGDGAALAERLAWAEAHPQAMRAMGDAARELHRRHLGPQSALASLVAIYEEAIAEARTPP